MNPGTYLLLALTLLAFAYLVFRVITRREYQFRGSLRVVPSGLQLLVFAAFFSFPYAYNPPVWGEFWRISLAKNPGLYLIGLIVVCLGFLTAFGTMAWFGIGQAFGIQNKGLRKTGPYQISRNPQILGGYLLVIGLVLQWPTLYMIGWVCMYAIITHWMVRTEEEHLKQVFGEAYETYCRDVPRYLRLGWNQE